MVRKVVDDVVGSPPPFWNSPALRKAMDTNMAKKITFQARAMADQKTPSRMR